MRLAYHSVCMMWRLVKHLLRQPWYVALTLIQPVIWLGLYGQLFKRVVDLPGFNSASYINFLTPGIVVMSSLFASGWLGMGVIEDLDRGVMDRFLLSPVQRPAIILGRLFSFSMVAVLEALILFAMGALLGARYSGGACGLLMLLLASTLLGVAFGSLSIALGLTVRKSDSLISAVNFILLPLTFTCPVFMAPKLMPEWMRLVSRFNPVGWSVEAGRAALNGNISVEQTGKYLLCLVAFTLISAWVANRAFQSYERSA